MPDIKWIDSGSPDVVEKTKVITPPPEENHITTTNKSLFYVQQLYFAHQWWNTVKSQQNPQNKGDLRPVYVNTKVPELSTEGFCPPLHLC